MPLHLPRKVISLSRFSVFGNLKKEEGRKREGMLERHKERSVFAGLCNCADLIGGERKNDFFISFLSTGEMGRGGGVEKVGMLERERQNWARVRETARE